VDYRSPPTGSAESLLPMWPGGSIFVLEHFFLKDFRVRRRDLSLGALGSVLNLMELMGVLTVIFTKVCS
jgi:hypothetical protein